MGSSVVDSVAAMQEANKAIYPYADYGYGHKVPPENKHLQIALANGIMQANAIYAGLLEIAKAMATCGEEEQS